jgi:hypothetical protein
VAGRPKRDPTVLRQLLWWELQWQITFCGLREGLPGWDTPLPDPKTAGLKWRLQAPHHTRTEDEKRFWRRHYEAHIQGEDEEFTKKIVLAEPRDLPAEPEIWNALCRPRTSAEEIRRLCRRSRYLRPCPGSPCPTALYHHAEEFRRAKRDERFPGGGKQNRKSSDEKRIDYLARVLAGLSMPRPMRPATAVDLLRKIKHTRSCTCWRCTVKRNEETLSESTFRR